MKIMLVEAPTIARSLQHMLSSHCYEVTVASEDLGRLSSAAADHHLIVVNTLLGQEVTLCQQLREDGCQTPILLLLPSADSHPGITTLKAGANDYVTKPFMDATLMGRVEFLLHCRPNSRQNSLQPVPTLSSVGEGIAREGITGSGTDVSDRQQTECQLQKQLERERLIAEITDSIRQTLDLDEILQAAARQVRHLLQTDRVIIFRFEPDWQGIVEAESVASQWVATQGLHIQDSCLSELYTKGYAQGRVSTIADIDTANIDPWHRELLKNFQVRANLVVPILQGEALWGLLIAHHCSGPRQWIAESTQLLLQVAAQLGIAIQQAELYQKTREQAALIDIATDAIFVRDLAGHIMFWSQGAERLYGWRADEAIGKVSHQLLKKEKAAFEIAFNTTLAQGFWQGELTQATKAGDEILVASRWTLVRDASGRPQSLLEVNTDITHKKQLEAQFYQAQRLESLGQLASGIAHDLGNMLTPILGIAQLLRVTQKHTDELTKKQLDLLESSARRGTDMVKQILTFAQGSPEEETIVDIVTLLQEVIDVARQGFPSAIEIHQNIAQASGSTLPLREVSADSTHLHQVFMNLCINARDAMPQGGVLTVAVDNCWVDEDMASKNLEATVGGYIVVTVTDTGSGIAPEIRDRIFDPFFTTKSSDRGTGLGLSTVSGIVKNAGGFLTVTSEVGKGTQMKVYLPALD